MRKIPALPANWLIYATEPPLFNKGRLTPESCAANNVAAFSDGGEVTRLGKGAGQRTRCFVIEGRPRVLFALINRRVGLTRRLFIWWIVAKPVDHPR